MLNALFHRFIPASLYGGPSAFPALAKIDGALRLCRSADAATSVIEKSKRVLYTWLRGRFNPTVAQGLAVKILNICLARYHFHARSAAVTSKPFGLIVDPSNMCQLACPGCVHSARSEALKLFDWRKGTLSEDCFSALLKLYGPYAIGIYFCNYGEPLLNLNTPRLIRQAKSYLMGTALSTSLSVRRFDADAYVELGLDFMALSIDGADPFNSEKYRQARSFFTGSAPASSDAPYCVQCEWDQTTVSIGGPEIRRYFRAADAAFFDGRSLRILSEW